METVLAINDDLSGRYRPESGICISGYTPEILTRIYDAHIRLCIYKRAMSADVKGYAVFLKNTLHNFQLTQTVPLHKLTDLLCVSLPQHQFRQSFIRDVHTVAEMYACLFGLHQIGFRLCVLNKTMCPRFHTDKVPCRLITTYSGEGTEWLDCMANTSDFLETLNQKPENYHSVQRLSPGDIALLKGDKWEENGDYGVIHRSPDVDGMRLLLSLDIAH